MSREDLQVRISLQDKITQGLGKVGSHLERMNQRTLAFQQQLRGNFDDMVAGVGTAIGAGASIYAAIMPNVELERSLNAINALGIDGELGTIRDAAQQFTRDFGGTSTEFVQHAATIKKAIGDVNESELAQITAVTAKLANATQSDVAQVSKYLGRLYHTYRDEADKIGKVDFLSNMANMTAIAAAEFGVSADDMAGSMESISALAKNYNIALPEQMAVMGALQVEYGEGDASSFYEAFIREGSKLGELGINTLDAQGQMLPILNILDQVKAKFGNLDASEFELLDETAGDAAMVIQTLLRQSDKLESSLSKMNLSASTTALDDMAQHHTDVIKELQGSWTVFNENIGAAVMPVITIVASVFITGIDWMSDLIQEFPTLTSAIIGTVLAVAAITTAISLGSAALAMMRVGMTALSPVLTLTRTIMTGLTINTQGYSVATLLASARAKSLAAVHWVANARATAMVSTLSLLTGASAFLSTRYSALTTSISAMTLASARHTVASKTMAAGQAALNLVMSLNPISLLVTGLAAGALMIMRYWEPISAFFSGFVDGLRASGLFDAFAPLGAVFGYLWDCISGIGSAMMSWLSPIEYANDELAGFASTGMMVGSMLGGVFTAIGEGFMSIFSGIIDLLNLIPGIDIELPALEIGNIPRLAVEPRTSAAISPNGDDTFVQTIAPVQPILTQSINNMQAIDPLKHVTQQAPAQSILASPQFQTKQSPSNSLTTGDIHIHKALAEFSLLGLDEQRILTIG